MLVGNLIALWLLICISLMTKEAGQLFIWLLVCGISFSCEMIFKIFARFFLLDCLSFSQLFVGMHSLFRTRVLSQAYILHIFFTILWLPVDSLNGMF